MSFPITSLYAMPLGLLGIVLWARVASLRAKLGISIGDGGDTALHTRIRQYGNFIEWVPMVLIFMVLAEGMGAPALWINLSGLLLLGGRMLHPFGLKADNASHPLRYVGNSASLLALLNLIVCLFLTSFDF